MWHIFLYSLSFTFQKNCKMLKSINKVESQHHLHLISVLMFDFKFKFSELSNNIAHDFNAIKM